MNTTEDEQRRGIDREIDMSPSDLELIDDFLATVSWDASGDPAPPKSALREILEVLSCSERMLFLALRHALEGDAGIASRLKKGGRLLVAVHVPSPAWRETTRAAFLCFVTEVAEGRPGDDADSTTFIAERSGRRSSARTFQLDAVLNVVNRQHLGLVVCPGDVVPDPVLSSVDACVRLEDLPISFLREALGQQFPGMEIPEGGSLVSADLSPTLIDNAARRCNSPAEVMRLLEEASVYEKTMQDEEKPEAKPGTAASTPRGFAATEILRPTSPKLSDLHGYGEAGAWGARLCEDLADYQAGRIPWSDVDAGCLLCGPPGTGKTLFASALAASSALPLIVTSYSDWQSQGEAHGGTLVKTIMMRFKDAGNAAPSIMFIDEIDAIPARGNGGRNADWWTPILTALLECLDGTNRREGLVVLAACNHPETLDPALVRSGRLDRRFLIDLPREDDLLRIFLHHLPGLSEGEIGPAATALAGFCSGADAARISREARRIARRANREPAASDLLGIALPPDHRPADLRRLAAIHEAGHAVGYIAFGTVPQSLSIVPGDGTHGGVVVPKTNGRLGRIEDIERMIIPLLCGRAAEEIVFGQASAGAGGPEHSDLARATTLISDLVGNFGLGGRLLHGAPIEPDGVELRLRRLYAESLLLMSRHRSAVLALADLALERRVLGTRFLSAFGKEWGFPGLLET